MKYIFDIPDQLIEVMETKQGSVKKYVETVLFDPLIREIRQDTITEINKTRVKELDKELNELKKGINIKVKEAEDPVSEETVASDLKGK